ncbi:hypothetical protein MKW92_038682 [Papaver armeniacum]|nr:hypothetical protein MKW92_038682 [Papaver armeniacum]
MRICILTFEPSPHKASKKNLLKKSDNAMEQNGLYISSDFINSNLESNFKGMGISLQLSKPGLAPLPPKVDSFSSLKPLEYDEIPELLYEVRSPPRCRTPDHQITSPSMNRYALSASLRLLGSP